YNKVMDYNLRPMSSDLMLECYVAPLQASDTVGARIRKYGTTYQGLVEHSGRMVIQQITPDGVTTELSSQTMNVTTSQLQRLQFAVVDRRVILSYGQETLLSDLASTRNGLTIQRKTEPKLSILGSGHCRLSHIKMYRDIHYTSHSRHSTKKRAVEGHPFQLYEDQFFVLGDNSPHSEDGRWWGNPAVASRGHTPPRTGIVPRHYLVGKALLVYWPSGYAFPWPTSIKRFLNQQGDRNGIARILRTLVNLRWIPNVGRMRFIYGGADETVLPVPNHEASAQTNPATNTHG
ncbi:MAG: S26 family signal peptidase, partial [Desulfobacterales bacterium]|nr:S26 family signal peptidase [Desulfobacterales bacterium]